MPLAQAARTLPEGRLAAYGYRLLLETFVETPRFYKLHTGRRRLQAPSHVQERNRAGYVVR